MCRPYLKDIINNFKKPYTWKIQLTMADNCISSIDNGKKHVKHSKIDNIKAIIIDKSLKNRYQIIFELLKGSEFVFDYAYLLYCKCCKINLNWNNFYGIIMTNNIYKDIGEDIEFRFDNSMEPLNKGKNEKVIGSLKDKLDEKIMTKFVCLGAKTYGYLIDDGSEDKKAKGTKMCVIKRKFKFENYKNCLQAIQRDNKISYLEKNKIDIDSLEKDHKEFLKKKQ